MNMNKVVGMAFACLIAVGGVNAQENGGWCGTDAHFEAWWNANPDQHEAFLEARDQTYERARQNLLAGNRNTEKVIIPTVVHVLYSDCDASISAAQVRDGIRILNEDMIRINPDSNETRGIFKPHAGVTNVEFRLAQIDPNGNPTSGITRTLTPAALNFGDANKSIINWPSNRYFNIWVVENIAGGGGGTILGYAQFPGTGSWSTYGIVMRDDMFGDIGTSTSDGRTLTHEVGHCLDLMHTFQSGCGGNCASSGDRICDTPPVVEASWACDFSFNTCNNDATGNSPYPLNTPDQIENYMSYNDCQNMFTKEQAEVMMSVLETFPVLTNLVSEANLEATGVGGFLTADFNPALDVVVANRQTSFVDLTRYGAEEWSWNFGASSFPPTSTAQSPSVTMITPGLRPVSLTVGQGQEELSITKNVLVAPLEGESIPLSTDFENIGSLPSTTWITKNLDEDANEFLVTTLAAYSGTQSIMLRNDGLCESYTDEIISTTLDFAPFDEVEFSFKAAYAKRNAESTDFLRVYVSRDYGATWQLAGIKGSSSLESVTGFRNGSWIPASLDDWKEHSFSIFQNNLMREGIMVKVQFVSEGGNNFFIDDMSFEGDFSGDLLLKNPKNGKAGLTSDVLLDWKAVGNAQTYTYELDKVNTFDSESLITGTTNFINSSADNEDTEVLIENLENGATYFWRVRYTLNGNDSEWSAIWSFQISEDGLSAPVAEQNLAWTVYPNPTNDLVTVKGTDRVINEIELLDLSGRRILQLSGPAKSSATIDMNGLDAGLYFLNVTDEQGMQSLIRVLKQ